MSRKMFFFIFEEKNPLGPVTVKSIDYKPLELYGANSTSQNQK